MADTETLAREAQPPGPAVCPARPTRLLGVVGSPCSRWPLLWAALSLPNRPEQVSPAALARIPLELLLLVALALRAAPASANRRRRRRGSGRGAGRPPRRARHRHAGRLLPHLRPAVGPVVPGVGIRRAAGQRRRRPGGPRHRRDRPGRPGGPGAAPGRRGPGDPGRRPPPAPRDRRRGGARRHLGPSRRPRHHGRARSCASPPPRPRAVAVEHVRNLQQGIADRAEFERLSASDPLRDRPGAETCSPGCRARTSWSSSSRATAGSRWRVRGWRRR